MFLQTTPFALYAENEISDNPTKPNSTRAEPAPNPTHLGIGKSRIPDFGFRVFSLTEFGNGIPEFGDFPKALGHFRIGFSKPDRNRFRSGFALSIRVVLQGPGTQEGEGELETAVRLADEAMALENERKNAATSAANDEGPGSGIVLVL